MLQQKVAPEIKRSWSPKCNSSTLIVLVLVGAKTFMLGGLSGDLRIDVVHSDICLRFYKHEKGVFIIIIIFAVVIYSKSK